MTWQRYERLSLNFRSIAKGIVAAAIMCTALPSSAQVVNSGGSSPGAIQHEGKSFRVVRAGGGQTAATGTGSRQSSKIQQVGLIGDVLHGRRPSCDGNSCGGCAACSAGNAEFVVGTYCGGACGDGSCGGTCGGGGQCNGDCGGTCNDCGNYGQLRTFGCFPYGHFNGPLCDSSYNPCNTFSNPCAGRICLPYSYVGLEGLYFGRGGDGDAGYDFTPGGRITIGRLKDCAEGCELVLTGIFDFEGDDAIVTPTGFASATSLNGDYEANFYSGEVSRVRMVDDIARLRIGARYVRYEEEVDNVTQTFIGVPPAVFSPFPSGNSIENNLVGGQIGADIYYPLSSRLYLDVRGRAGAYINFAEIDQAVTTAAGTTSFSDEDEELAGLFEGGLGVRYFASRRLTVFARGELWYLSGVATSQTALEDSLSGGLTSDIDLDDDVVIFGFSGGAELKF